jgi:hypothetical protein
VKKLRKRSTPVFCLIIRNVDLHLGHSILFDRRFLKETVGRPILAAAAFQAASNP